jgi:hypothetical protein
LFAALVAILIAGHDGGVIGGNLLPR